jgi:cell wall assembly regulator SMI1
MKRLFDRIHVWLRANAPEVLASLRTGATEEAIRAAEREMGVSLPDDVRAAYRIHDGQAGQNLFGGRLWLPLADVVGTWRRMKGCVEDGPPAEVPAEADVREDYWHPAWIPLAWGEWGDLLCIDLDTGPEGGVGQVILWWPDLEPHASLVTPSFTHWLRDLASELEHGEWTTHPDYEGLVRVGEIDDE